MIAQTSADDLALLLQVLPPHIREHLQVRADLSSLVEIVIDLGRRPQARFEAAMSDLAAEQVSRDDIAHVVSRVGAFSDDNRAGIERTLHRISAMRNRTGAIIGLTCRVGRAVFGTVDIIRDVIEAGNSLLLLGPPGVGKTTILREAARVLADDLGKRVVIVDTSNEIGGDGDIPHPGIGRARRMQVPSPFKQHSVMIEAVENHMPEVIVIDEIGTEAEAGAARTIAERGVQLIATAHGKTIGNLLQNPTLMDLVGGIMAVTLSDEEARRRRTQKTVLERKAPPTFNVMIEIQERDRVAVYDNVAEMVDLFLRGERVASEVRTRTDTGEVVISREEIEGHDASAGRTAPGPPQKRPRRKTMRIFSYGVSKLRLDHLIQALKLPATLVAELGKADIILTLKSQEKRQPREIREAEARGIPRYVLKSNTATQMENFLRSVFPPDALYDEAEASAIREAESALETLLEQGRPVELAPRNAHVRRLQHLFAERHGVRTQSTGREPNRRVVFHPGENHTRNEEQ